MSQYSYKLNIADSVFQLDVPIPIELDENCRPFIVDSKETDIHIIYDIGMPQINSNETLVKDRDPRVWRGSAYFRVERHLLSSHPSGCIYFDDEETVIRGLLYSDALVNIKQLVKLLEISEPEILFARRKTISLHSSVVRLRDRAILFTAPSGTGKTTQAKLWEHYCGAEQLNGDRGFIKKENGTWTVYGAPFSGTSGIYRNEYAPIQTIVVLRQSENNTIMRLSQSEAFRYLYSETVIPLWNSIACASIVDIIANISKEIPVLLLCCTPDERAVQLLDSFLREEKIC